MDTLDGDEGMINNCYYFDESVEEEFGGSSAHSRPASENGDGVDNNNGFAEVAASIGVQLGDEIAGGHYGRVFRGAMPVPADPSAPPLLVCAKFLKPQESIRAQRQQVTNFQREVTLMNALNHPNILKLICATHMPMMCIVTPFMVGGNLFEAVHAAGALQQPAEQLRAATEVASAMAYLHSMEPPIVHRDLTSPNVLLDETGSCKLSDFGLAKIKDPLLAPSGQRGNLGWVAPEAIHQSAFEPSSDVYSFGVIVWELRSRLIPFAGCSPAEIRRQKLSGSWPTVSSLPDHGAPGAHPAATALNNVLLQCVQLNPDRRPSFTEILQYLSSPI